jgi:serine/threonine-protein kinase
VEPQRRQSAACSAKKLTVPFQKFGRYEIEQELGRGGMAVVYLARDPYVKRQVAVKVLPHQFTSDPQFRARFQREAEIIAALEHPHIVPIYDYGEQDEQLFLVMRYMTGGSLADHVRRGPLSTTDIARIVTPLASALDKAHAQGIIHRDLKPGNILFDGDGEPYISDFGIAKLTQASTLLSGSALVGTPVYMSPEQWRGEKVDGRSDIYALGGMLYEMFSGRLPYEASTPAEVMFKCLMEPPPRLLESQPELDPALETVVARAMAKDREERFGTAGEMARALETAIRGAVGVPIVEPAAMATEGPLPDPLTIIEESPATETPIALPTVVATPLPIPVAVAPEAIKVAAEPIPEAPPTVVVPIEVIEAAPVEEPRAEAIPAEIAPEAGVLVQAGLPVDAAGATSEAASAMVETEARPAAPGLTAENEPMTPTVITPPAQPMKQSAPRLLTRFALPAMSVAVIVLLIVGGAIFGPGFFSTSAATPTEMGVAILGTISSPTLTISPSPTLTLTPTIAPTWTPRPSTTLISENDTGFVEPVEPIVAFAEPILAAIAGQKPDFQDDFSTRAGGWAMPGGCPEWKLKFVDGEMVVSNCHVFREMWYTDFVAEMDARFLPGSSPYSQWRFSYRHEPTPGSGGHYFFDFGYSGGVTVGFFEEPGLPGKYTHFPDTAQPGLSVNHVLIIVKDQAVALFVNDRPVYYGALPILWKNGGMEWSIEGGEGVAGLAALDNLKIWDISNIPLTATPAP